MRDRGLRLHVTQISQTSPTACSPAIQDAIEKASASAGFLSTRLPSGAGHDAMVMAARVPTAMLFLRSPGGISHHPAETVFEDDVEAALHVGREFLRRLASNVG